MKYILRFATILFISSLCFSCHTNPTDEEIQKNINDLFTKDMAGAALNATVDSGVATVTGQCSGAGCTNDVITKVKKIKGVKDVQAHIVEQ